LAAPLQADYQSALNAYQTGDYPTAMVLWQQIAESPAGTVDQATRAESLYAIGMLFWLGQGVQQDTIESASWMRLAAELHHPGAQNKLAYLYSTGQGVRQSHFEALKWWQMAANQGDADAQYNLGVIYRDGVGVEPNANESLKWFREAAANGDLLSVSVIENYQQTGSMLAIDGSRLVPDPVNESWPVPASSQPEVTADVPAKTVIMTTEEPRPPADKSPGAINEDWIRERAPANYTIQVIALSQPEKLQAYIDQHPELSPFAIYAQTRYEQPLWVLVQGDYADVESARQAVREFPQDMQKRDKLWIRHFSMVQRLLE